MPKVKSTQPLVSFIVVNWDGLANTQACLASIRKITYNPYEIVVVDNGSKDGSKQYFAQQKDITFVDLPQNTGFTGGHIAGAQAALGEYLAILNNDLVIDTQWLDHALDTFACHADAAIVGGKAYQWNDTNPVYNTTNDFYSYQEVDPSTGYTKTLLTGEDECAVDSISGAALLIKRSSLKDVGYFDDDFFAYYEETDLIARLKRSGLEAYYNPLMHTWHKVAASSSGGASSDFYLRQMHRNRYYFAYKNYDAANLKRFLNNYSREVNLARLKVILKRGVNPEVLARLAAAKEVKIHKQTLIEKRQAVLQLGSTYNQKLNIYKPTDVTIIIPCYNYADYVAEAIQSALNQTVPPKNIIVINDGSTDDSLKQINQFKDNPLVTVIDKKNEGVIAAKNLGIQLADTYWTMFLDADDIIDQDMLRIMLRSVREEGLVDVIYSDMKLFGAINDYFRAKPFQPHTFLAQNYINNTTLINTTSLKRTGGYKQAMKGGLEDWELYVTLFEQHARFRYIPQALVHYRQHDGANVVSRNSELQDIENGRKHYALIQSLHPACFRYNRGAYKYATALGRALYLTAKHPAVFLVMLRAVPAAIKQSLRHILHEARLYLHSK